MKHLKNFDSFRLFETIKIDRIEPSSFETQTVTSMPYTSLIRENRYSFLKKLIVISKNLGVNPLWLMHIIFHESEFDSKKYDKKTASVGLLSFSPEVVKTFIDPQTGKNLTKNDVLNMSNLDQLDLVNSFYKASFQKYGIKSPISSGDFAALTFYPFVIGKKDSWEFPEIVVQTNKPMFDEFPSVPGKTKKDYYEYTEALLKNEGEFDGSKNYLFGSFSGAFIDPSITLEIKPSEYYKELLNKIDDPAYMASLAVEEEKENEENKK
jgi:hypothetical protein